jgi:hypothetical protein
MNIFKNVSLLAAKDEGRIFICLTQLLKSTAQIALR